MSVPGLRLKTTLTYILFTGMMVAVGIVIVAIYFPVALQKYHREALEIEATESHASPTFDLLEDQLRRDLNLASMERISSGMIIVLVFSAGGIAFLHSRWVIKPILELSRASRQIADGHLSMRVNERGNDEIAQLGQSFNLMPRNWNLLRIAAYGL